MSWPLDPPSPLWASLSEETFSAPSLDGDGEADVAVIGGGIGGLAAALELRRAGLRTTVLEARAVGSGASGRNNGQVIPTLTRHDPLAVLKVMGPERGERFLRMLERSADLLFDTVAQYGIRCDAVRAGWIQPAHSPGRARLAAKRVEQWQARGAPVEYLDRAALAARLGSAAYCGGWLHRGGGHINPLAFTQGLARAVRQEGGLIFENSPVLSLERETDGWRLRTPRGSLRCHRVVLITAAHTGGLWPGLARTIVPVTSYQVATEPLSAPSLAKILPGNEGCSDTRIDLRYFRKDREGRLVSGGALAFQILAQQRVPRLVGQRFAETFPELGAPRAAYFWGGRIAMTVNRLPRLHRTPDGLVSWIGCNGRGLALAMGMGAVIRDAVQDRPDDELALAPSPLQPVPFHGIVRRMARIMLVRYRALDRREI
jgi:glycine/D-amino acid oxidase-like deaminating enzyme